MTDAELSGMCRLPADTPAEVLEMVRAAARLVERWEDGKCRAGMAVALAAAMGRAGGWSVQSLPFGTSGPRVEHKGWVKRDDLVDKLMQLGEVIVGSRFDAEQADWAVFLAVDARWLRLDRHDTWLPGMKSGSGWVEVVEAQPVGIARALEMAMAHGQGPCPLQSPPPPALPPHAPAASPPGTSAPTSTKPANRGKPSLQPWTQADLNKAIRQYKADRAGSYADLRDAVKRNKAGARKRAKEIYGRNAIARALGVKSKAMVSKSPAWVAIAEDLGMPLNRNRRAQGTRHTQRPGKVGHEIAVEDKSANPAEGADNAPAEQPWETAERQETIRRINALASAGKSAKEEARNQEAAHDLIQKLQRGEYTDDQAREVVEMALDTHD